LQKYTTKNKIRFAFWGAEESGMAGSTHYVSSLSSLSASQILLYLNFDMVGQGFYGVFDSDGSTFGAQMAGPPGSGVIERLFVEELERQGHVVVPLPLNRGSDYKSFMDGIGKPVGGLHSGTGKEQDKCYHLACDTYANVDPAMMGVMAKVSVLLSGVAFGSTRARSLMSCCRLPLTCWPCWVWRRIRLCSRQN
jgi:Zn-dependent M28 family amino/carboxypeptidase